MTVKKPAIIHFTVSVAQVRTLADGGLRYTFDGPEEDTNVAKTLMDVRRAGGILEIAAVAVIQKLPEKLTKIDDATQKETARKSSGTNRRRR
jgi:hypothetical protein